MADQTPDGPEANSTSNSSIVMHIISKGYHGGAISIPCIQLCKEADDEIGLNPITADISSSNGHVVIFKDGLLNESKMLLQDCSKTECVACIFINSSDTLDLTVTSSNVNFNDYNFPIYLLRKDHGLKLLDQMINVSKVSIKTELVQQSQKQQWLQHKRKSQTRQYSPSVILKYYRSNWIAGVGVDCAQEILKYTYYLFNDEGHHLYYHSFDGINQHIFHNAFDDTFPVLFPVYIYYASMSYMHSHKQEISSFVNKPGIEYIEKVAKKFEDLVKNGSIDIIQHMQNFRSADSKERWKSLATQFLKFLDIWIKESDCLPSAIFVVAIPIIVIAQMISKDCGMEKNDYQEYWNSYLIKHSKKIYLRQHGGGHLHSFNDGMIFISCSQVPSEHYFTPKHLKEICIRSGHILLFVEAINMIVSIPVNLKYEWQTSFVSDFVVPLRDIYEHHLKQKKYSSFTAVCFQGHWIGIITEGIMLLRKIKDFMENIKCEESLNTIQWLAMFAKCVNFEQVRTDNDIKLIELLLNEDMIISPKDMETIKCEILSRLKPAFEVLSPKDVLFIEKFVNNREICDSNTFFREYFRATKIKLHIKDRNKMICSKSSYHDVLKQFLIRNANESKSAMLEFLEQVYNYMNDKELTSFYFDLMHFGDLLKMALKFVKNDEKNFEEFFRKKILITPLIPLTIFNKIEIFLEESATTENDLQLALCHVLVERFQILELEFKEYKNHFMKIIKIAHSYLHSESLASILTTPQIKFTCGILAIIVSKIKLGLDLRVARNPVILPLLEALQPLFELRNKLPESCYEAQECLKLFDDVRKRINSFSLQLKDMSIQFHHLHYHYENKNSFQEFVKIAQVVEVDENTIETIENINDIYEGFIAVRKEITEIMLPSSFIDGKWLHDSLYRILKRYHVSVSNNLLEDMMHTVNECEIERIIGIDTTMQVTPVQLTFNDSMTLSKTKHLLKSLKDCLGPLCANLSHICFFEHFRSDFFLRSLSQPSDHEQHTCDTLSKACDNALHIIDLTVQGDVSLRELGLNLSEDTRNEISNFEKLVYKNKQVELVQCHLGLKGFDALVSLTNIHEGVLLLKEVCKRFKLENCIHDDTFLKLSAYSDRIRTPVDISFKDASYMRMEFQEAFPHLNGNFNVYFNLFRELKDSFSYVKFLRKRGFIGEGGKRKFSKERNLITQEIQDTLEQRIIDDLWDAYSTLSHFLDDQVTYHTLKLGLEKLHNVEKCTFQIKALLKHSTKQLDKVFALKQSQTKESTLFRLRSLMKFGEAIYEAPRKNSPVILTISYKTEAKGNDEKLDLKGFSEVATASELLLISMTDDDNVHVFEDMKIFLVIYESCLQIIDVLEKLKNAGHFDYQMMKRFKHPLSKQQRKWDTELQKLKDKLHECETITPIMREKYSLLSFFSNWKIYQIFKIITATPFDADELKKVLKGTMLFIGCDMSDVLTDVSIVFCLPKDVPDPFLIVGETITATWERVKSPNLKLNRSHSCLRYDSNHISLYLLADCSNLKLYRVALRLLMPVKLPLKPFQILTCTTGTTQEAITLFFQRIKLMSVCRYILMDVNIMSLKLQEVLMKECTKLLEHGNKNNIFYDIMFIENRPSIIRTMPWCFQENKSPESDDKSNLISLTEDYTGYDNILCKLVYGQAGDGKSHYISSKINKLRIPSATFPINESFSAQNCIEKLNVFAEKKEFAIHLNFTLPFLKKYTITKEENETFQMTCKIINSFLFNLLMCGYVEDFDTGETFSMGWLEKLHLFVEIPVMAHRDNVWDYIEDFAIHFPVFFFLKPSYELVCSKIGYNVSSDDAVLVCKYFDADVNDQLDKIYKASKKSGRIDNGIQIGTSYQLPEGKCAAVLKDVFQKYGMNKENKIHQKMFVRYMYRRCLFMEMSTLMRYYEGKLLKKKKDGHYVPFDARNLRSSLLNLMAHEASEICSPMRTGNGFIPPSIQLIYDEASFSVIAQGDVSEDRMKIITAHEFHVPDPLELEQQTVLEDYLCQALKVQRNPEGEISILKARGYILTVDYLLKMIGVHERQQCGMPVVISGETGVGKTFLLETLSELYNYSLHKKLNYWRNKLQKFLIECTSIQAENEEEMKMIFSSLSSHVRVQSLKAVLTWFRQHTSEANSILDVFSLIEFVPVNREIPNSFSEEACRMFLLKFLFGERRKLFNVLKVHTGLTPSDIREFLQPIFDEEWDLKGRELNRPKVTVFFDELNTSSCIGLLKEIIIDHSLDGKPIPDNVFIVAACNPHRGNSISTIIKPTGGLMNEQWFKGDYLVHPLHPSFEQIMWDFGYLKPKQEREYIKVKLEQVDATLHRVERTMLVDNIADSQELIRRYTYEWQVNSTGGDKAESRKASESAVSQRDIQRVLKLYQWLKMSNEVLGKYGYCRENEDKDDYNRHISVRALYVSLSLVYYFRLNKEYRDKYAKILDANPMLVMVVEENEGILKKRANHIKFTVAVQDELDWLMRNIELPPGIANTKALRENLFSIITCCMTKIPLIIIGPPGSSKTISFKIAVANLLGEVSPRQVFRSKVMKGLEPYIYQCSKHSVTEDIDYLFEKAIKRQTQIDSEDSTVVVFMDEAGLPEEKLQVLKVLHYHLDNPKVPFVALTNTALDAAKSNRAICLFQVNNSDSDLIQLASVILGFSSEQIIPLPIEAQITSLIQVYLEKMKHTEFNRIFGLRDIMHFFAYIRRRMPNNQQSIPPDLMMRSLRRNFSGASNFDELVEDFLNQCGLNISQIPQECMISSILALRDSLFDKARDLTYENEVRYKLVIDYSEDESLLYQLFKFGIVGRDITRIYCLSKLPGDKLHKATTLAKIKNSIVNGHTICLAQCDEIFESFYDLFNQRYTFIDDHETKRRNYYARIASGAKSTNCLVDPSFQCIVIIKFSEVRNIPAPFMNRFEKYPLSHEAFLSEICKESKLTLNMLCEAGNKVKVFLEEIPPPGLYGFKEQTLQSLLLAHVAINGQKDGSLVDHIITVSPGGIPIITALENYVLRSEKQSKNTVEIDEDIEYCLVKEELQLTMELIVKIKKFLFEIVDTKMVDDVDVLKSIYMITQFFCVRLMKELLQLMPPEVFIAMKEKLPEYYIKSYLTYQFHFSLQELVQDRIKESYFNSSDNENVQAKTNKTLCYSRTTSLLFEKLPHEFFSFDPEKNKFEKQEQLKVVFPKLTKHNLTSLCVVQLFRNTSSSFITKSINKFLLMSNYAVMLFLVNMEHLSAENVNYLRIAINETEFNVKDSPTRKQFIILLQFPAENFFLHCYPSFYQDEWDFYYLDSIAPTAKDKVVDLKKCFNYAYQNEKGDELKFMDKVVESLLSLESAAFSAAHISSILHGHVSRSFLSNLLSLKEYNSIGEPLKKKFVQQWNPSRMMQTLQQAANSALSFDYSLNMTDAINTIIKSNFYDFMHYMLTILARHGALDILLKSSVPKHFLELIHYQIESSDLPSSSTEMKIRSTTVNKKQKSSTEMKIRSTIVNKKQNFKFYFPFFHDIFRTVEDLCRDPNTDKRCQISIKDYAEKLKSKIENLSLVSATIHHMTSHIDLWRAYMLQFLNQFHDISVTKDSELFKYFFVKSECYSDMLHKLVWLHRSFDFIPHNIVKFLKFFDTLNSQSGKCEATQKNMLELLEDPVKCANEVIERFFVSLKIIAETSETDEECMTRINSYRLQYHEMFLSSPLKELIHIPLSSRIEAIRDGIAVFFTLINTGVHHNQALELLKHFTDPSFKFSEQLQYRSEYLMKMPVEKLTNAPFHCIFTDQYPVAKGTSVRNFIVEIVRIVIEYSSEHQNQILHDWFCKDICTNPHLDLIPVKHCTGLNCISSLCFLEKVFTIVSSNNDENHLVSMLKQLQCNVDRKISYLPYFLREVNDAERSEICLEPLMTLLYLKQLKSNLKRDYQIANLVTEYQKIKDIDDLQTLIWREVIIFLIIQETAKNIVNRTDILIFEVDNILLKEQYGILLTYCIYRRCRSFHKLRKFMLQENELCKAFTCLQNIKQLYSQEKVPDFLETSPHALLNTLSNKMLRENAKQIFTKVHNSVKEMVTSSKQDIPASLYDTMALYCVLSVRNKQFSTNCMFKISLFLSAYHFREKFHISQSSVLMTEKVNIYVGLVYTKTLSWFISGGRAMFDDYNPLTASISSTIPQKDDFIEMWDYVVNLIAAIHGACEKFSSFYIHLLTPSSLDGSYIPGSTTRGKVGAGLRMYNNAMELSNTGLCTSYLSYKYVTRGIASLPCLYFIQWANYTCLYVYLQLQCEKKAPFNGKLFLDPSSAKQTCLAKMEKIWLLFIRNFDITAEQRNLLINLCIGRIIEKIVDTSVRWPSPTPETQEELDKYEKFINDKIFIPSWNTMTEQTSKNEKELVPGSINHKLMKMKYTYPCLPDKHSFLLLLMTSTNFNNKDGKYYALYQFLLYRPVLNKVLNILPKMADFYQWIHQQFPHCLTKKQAKTTTVGDLLRSEKYNHVGYSFDVRNKRIAQFNKLCELTQTLQRTYEVGCDVPPLEDGMLLIEAVCTSDVTGLINKWITLLIKYNNTIVCDCICESDFGHTNDDVKKIIKTSCQVFDLDDGNDDITNFDDISDILPLLENCCCLSAACTPSVLEDDKSLLPTMISNVYHLNELQNDVAASMMSKLKQILPISCMIFTFINVQESVSSIFVESAAVSLDDLENNCDNIIPKEFLNDPDDKYKVEVLEHCHSLSYFSLLEITAGLRIAMEYLTQNMPYKDSIEEMSLHAFLQGGYVILEDIKNINEIFSQGLGIDLTRLSELQVKFLMELKMKNILKALKTFIEWFKIGLYDFSSFSVVLKENLSDSHQKILTEISDEAISLGEGQQILETIQLISHSLSLCEKKMKEISDPSTCNRLIKELLIDAKVKTGKHFDSFPDVPISQYVRYRLALRTLHRNVLKNIHEGTPGSARLNLTYNDSVSKELLLRELQIEVKIGGQLMTTNSDVALCDLSYEQIAEFIRKNNFNEKYSKSALDNEVDGEILVSMTDKQVRSLLQMNKDPIAFLQFKFKIRRTYGESKAGRLAMDYPSQAIAEMCAQRDCLKTAVALIMKYDVDGEMITEADDDVFKKLSTADWQLAKKTLLNLILK